MEHHIGQQLGNYRLLSLLGTGSFAKVYLGEHLHLKSHAAIKVLHVALIDKQREDFLMEAQRLMGLRHPHIVRILDFAVEADVPFLVMDYEANGSLRQRHPTGTLVPLETIVAYVKHIADALQYIHKKNLIHRDVKPDNVLLGSDDAVILSDLGVAAVAHATSSLVTQGLAGTPLYMAPEQIRGRPRCASDQYALGVVVYEWLCGECPFRGNPLNILDQHLYTPPPLLHERLSTISANVENVVFRALAKDPQQRFANVQDFSIALEQAYQEIQVPSVPNTNNQPRAKHTDPHILQTPDASMAPLNSSSADEDKSPTQPTPVNEGTTQQNTNMVAHERMTKPLIEDAIPAHLPIGTITPPLQNSSLIVPRRRTKRRPFMVTALVLFTVLLTILGSIAYATPGTFVSLTRILFGSPSTAIVTLTPKSNDLKKTYTIFAVTGTPDISQHQVKARVLSSTTSSQSKAVPTTGVKKTIGTQATGILTFTNYYYSPYTFDAGTVYSNDEDIPIQMMLDATVTVPARIDSNTAGTVTVPAHVVQYGTIGNITTWREDTRLAFGHLSCSACNGTDGWYLYNINSPFSGGQDPRSYSSVAQSDIDGAANALETAYKRDALQEFQGQVHANERFVGTPTCDPNVNSDHNAGDAATTVTVWVSFTCTGEVYDQQGVVPMAKQWLMQDAAQSLGAGYMLVGTIMTTQGQAKISDTNQGTVLIPVTAEGIWVYQFSSAQEQAMAKQIVGKKKAESYTVLLRQQGVAQVNIQLSGGDGNTLPIDFQQIRFVILSVHGK